ncbi:MAG: elongation factor G [Planctomycetota bacterium]
MVRKIENIRNIGIVAHIDAGKTTVTEHMLYLSGAKHRVGRVDQGTAETDCDQEEQDRGITIYSACVTFQWGKRHINLLDTPGHVDFTAEVERCLRVLDGAVVVFSAREGVEAQSETVWRQADHYHVPRIAFVNKMDREGADFEATVRELESRLGAQPLVIALPVGQGPAHVSDPFRGTIDLIEMRLLEFNAGEEGERVIARDIPEPLMADALAWREEMLEKLYSYSNEMIELAMAEQPIPAELIRKVIRDATLHGEVQPVLCGSALRGVGVQPVLDAVGYYLPCPLDCPPVEGFNPKEPERIERRRPASDEPFCGLVFKILPAKTADLYWVRVYSGKLKANSRVWNPQREKKENVAQLWQIHATKKERDGQVPQIEPGDIAGVIGPRHSITGDTWCDPRHPIQLPSIQFAETVLSMAIEPESAAERKKLSDTLEMLKRQDPTFDAVEHEDTGQTLISGMGELHLEVIKHRLLREFNLDVKVHAPRVSYRETVEHEARVTGQCNRQVGGKQLFARLSLEVGPAPEGKQAQVLSRCSPDEVAPEFAAAALEELAMCARGGGPIGSFPLTGLKVTLIGGEQHLETSDETAFRIAAVDAFEKGLQASGPVLLEPVMRLDITAPEEYLGDIVGDLQQRRALIRSTHNRGSDVVIEAHAPLRELFGYANAIRSLSQGRANCSMEPFEYGVAPPEVAQEYGV